MNMRRASTALLLLSGLLSMANAAHSAEQAGELSERQRQAMMRQYLMEQSYRHADQQMEQERQYGSSTAQQGSNQGGAQGHQLGQHQGDVGVGALVGSGAYNMAPPAGGRSLQFAPQSNSLTIGQDNYAPVQLSNIAASNGSVHIGDVNQGNMYNSQIGNNQSGEQFGDSSNQQVNDQSQQAASQTGSSDAVQNP